eukprot:TRINITY_DN6976_c0_g1_i2.p1 TRINITY_DN6976_c0_g1~~TRINITY_DN6976_c0_g1_i2.p1  ORF type:complete len:439 (-),score=61.50 TRINITY_DN6976_c0_g1_i2:70-1386(-)
MMNGNGSVQLNTPSHFSRGSSPLARSPPHDDDRLPLLQHAISPPGSPRRTSFVVPHSGVSECQSAENVGDWIQGDLANNSRGLIDSMPEYDSRGRMPRVSSSSSEEEKFLKHKIVESVWLDVAVVTLVIVAVNAAVLQLFLALDLFGEPNDTSKTFAIATGITIVGILTLFASEFLLRLSVQGFGVANIAELIIVALALSGQVVGVLGIWPWLWSAIAALPLALRLWRVAKIVRPEPSSNKYTRAVDSVGVIHGTQVYLDLDQARQAAQDTTQELAWERVERARLEAELADLRSDGSLIGGGSIRSSTGDEDPGDRASERNLSRASSTTRVAPPNMDQSTTAAAATLVSVAGSGGAETALSIASQQDELVQKREDIGRILDQFSEDLAQRKDAIRETLRTAAESSERELHRLREENRVLREQTQRQQEQQPALPRGLV